MGRELRKLNIGNAATLLVMKALTEDDRDRLARLKEIGDELLARAADVFSDEDPANAATVTGWASQLDSENYPSPTGPTDRSRSDSTRRKTSPSSSATPMPTSIAAGRRGVC